MNTAALGGKDSTNYTMTLIDIGLEGGYGVVSSDLYGLANNEVLFAMNQTYDEATQDIWHSLLLDLGLLTAQDTTVEELGGKDTEAYVPRVVVDGSLTTHTHTHTQFKTDTH